MRLPIDTSEMAFQVLSRPEPLRDPTSARARTTREGRPLFMVQLVTSWRGTVGTIAVEVRHLTAKHEQAPFTTTERGRRGILPSTE